MNDRIHPGHSNRRVGWNQSFPLKIFFSCSLGGGGRYFSVPCIEQILAIGSRNSHTYTILGEFKVAIAMPNCRSKSQRRTKIYTEQMDTAVLGDRLPEVTRKPFLGPKKASLCNAGIERARKCLQG